MAEPRIILYDIETTHNLVAVFRLFGEDNRYINHENMVRERYIVSVAWKVLGEKTVHAVSVLDDPKRYKANPHDDRHVCDVLHDVLSSADIIVAHNGDAYDIKFTEARMLYHGLSPLPPILKIDTKKIAKDRFLFNSNRLDYLGMFLKVGRKLETEKGLWLKVLAARSDAPQAIRKMVRYNKGDILLLERIFYKLRPYMPNLLNRELIGQEGGKGLCPRCGSIKVQSRGIHRSITQAYRRFACQDCGGWFRYRLAEKTRTTTRLLA